MPTAQDLCSSFFDHPADRDWMSPEGDVPCWPGDVFDLVRLTAEVFEDPDRFLGQYSSSQVANGLGYLISSCGVALLWRISDTEVPWVLARRCLRSIPVFFERYVAPRCPELLDRIGDPHRRLADICFMWWDSGDCYARQAHPERPEFDTEVLGVMESILALSSHLCQESALHGLGQWHHAYREHVENVIGAYLETHPSIPAELREYVEDAYEVT